MSAATLVAGGGQAAAARGVTTRLSVSSSGGQANGLSDHPAISADGRYVAFEGTPPASNLVPDDTNAAPDVFVHDRLTSTTVRVSVGPGGVQSNGGSAFAAMSADGRYVAFQSVASNLVPGDTNGQIDVFVHDILIGITSRVSVRTGGEQVSIGGGAPAISADGRYVAFVSPAPDLVPGDTNGTWDVFVHDRLTVTTSRVSVDSRGVEGNGPSLSAAISADGRYVAFTSAASNLVAGDANGVADVFVHDRLTGETTRVSVGVGDAEGDGPSGDTDFAGNPTAFHNAYLSADGRYVAFTSAASNLVPNDTNGVADVFVHDRLLGTTTRVSVPRPRLGDQANGPSFFPAISLDGRFVAFTSLASNLVRGDANGAADVFLHDCRTHRTTLVSVDSHNLQGNGASAAGDDGLEPPVVSLDGRLVAFASFATNLVPGDTNGTADIFLRCRRQCRGLLGRLAP